MLQRWLRKNILEPLFYGEGYNIYTTALVAFLFISAFYFLWKYLRRFDQKRFREAIFPWMVAGGFVRFLDPRLFHTPFTITPGIWFLIGIPALLLFFYDPELCKKIGIILAIFSFFPSLFFLHFSKVFYAIAALTSTAVFYFLIRRIPWMRDEFAWFPHLFEAWITSFGVLAGLHEEHVVANFIMQLHPLLFGFFKSLTLVFIFYFLQDLKENERIYTGTAIASLAVGPALRDLLELLSL